MPRRAGQHGRRGLIDCLGPCGIQTRDLFIVPHPHPRHPPRPGIHSCQRWPLRTHPAAQAQASVISGPNMGQRPGHRPKALAQSPRKREFLNPASSLSGQFKEREQSHLPALRRFRAACSLSPWQRWVETDSMPQPAPPHTAPQPCPSALLPEVRHTQRWELRKCPFHPPTRWCQRGQPSVVWGPRGGSQRLPSLCLRGRPDSACIATGSAQRSQRGRPRAGHSRPGGAGLAASEESEAAQP